MGMVEMSIKTDDKRPQHRVMPKGSPQRVQLATTGGLDFVLRRVLRTCYQGKTGIYKNPWE